MRAPRSSGPPTPSRTPCAEGSLGRLGPGMQGVATPGNIVPIHLYLGKRHVMQPCLSTLPPCASRCASLLPTLALRVCVSELSHHGPSMMRSCMCGLVCSAPFTCKKGRRAELVCVALPLLIPTRLGWATHPREVRKAAESVSRRRRPGRIRALPAHPAGPPRRRPAAREGASSVIK